MYTPVNVNTRYSNPRLLPWENSYNIRDLGGYPTQDGGQTCYKAIIRADNLSSLTPIGQADLLGYGIWTIIDLRSPAEANSTPHAFMQPRIGFPAYHNLPLLNLEDNARMAIINEANSMQESYCLMLEEFKENVASVFKAIAHAHPGGVLIHCHAGKDRTGLVAALLLDLAGVSPATIAEDYAESDSHLGPLYEQILAAKARNPIERQQLAKELVSLPGAMLGTLEYLEWQYSGVQRYLQAVGVTWQEMELLRKRLRT